MQPPDTPQPADSPREESLEPWDALPEISVSEPADGAGAWEERVRLHDGPFAGTWAELETAIRTGEVDPRRLPLGPLAGSVHQALAEAEAPPGGPSSEAWLLVALAQLSRWKAARLFPDAPQDAADGEEDGGDDLVRHLLRYERYRELARALEERAERESRRFPALLSENLPWNEGDLALEGLDLADLGQVFLQVLAAAREQETGLAVDVEPVTVAERLDALRQLLAGAAEPVPFTALFTPAAGLRHAVVTFLALLELAHQRQVALRQERPMGPIYVVWRGEDQGAAAP